MNNFDYEPNLQSTPEEAAPANSATDASNTPAEPITTVFTYGTPTQSQKKKTPGFALASMLCGIGGIACTCLCCCFYFVAPVLLVLAVVFAFIAKKKNEGKMPSMAIAGLILAVVTLILFLVILILDIYLSNNMDVISNAFEEATGMSLEDLFASIDGTDGGY